MQKPNFEEPFIVPDGESDTAREARVDHGHLVRGEQLLDLGYAIACKILGKDTDFMLPNREQLLEHLTLTIGEPNTTFSPELQQTIETAWVDGSYEIGRYSNKRLAAWEGEYPSDDDEDDGDGGNADDDDEASAQPASSTGAAPL